MSGVPSSVEMPASVAPAEEHLFVDGLAGPDPEVQAKTQHTCCSRPSVPHPG